VTEIQPDEVGAVPVSGTNSPKVSRRALSRLKRELTDEELSSAGVQKMLLESLARAEEENEELKTLRDKYYGADKQLSVLQEKLKTSAALEVVSMGTLAAGTAAMAYAPTLWASQPSGWIVLAFGVVLTAVGIFAKVIRA
jgi:hypothetical protein